MLLLRERENTWNDCYDLSLFYDVINLSLNSLPIIILFSFGEFFSNNEFQYDKFRASRRWI